MANWSGMGDDDRVAEAERARADDGATAEQADVVALVVSDGEGRWLQIRRGADVAHPGLLCFPGGTVEPGESLTEALVREAAEELGVVAVARRPLTVAQVGAIRLHAWECTVSGVLVPDPREVAEVLWLTTEQILAHPDSMPSSLLVAGELHERR